MVPKDSDVSSFTSSQFMMSPVSVRDGYFCKTEIQPNSLIAVLNKMSVANQMCLSFRLIMNAPHISSQSFLYLQEKDVVLENRNVI